MTRRQSVQVFNLVCVIPECIRPEFCHVSPPSNYFSLLLVVVNMESRSAHLSTLIQEAQQRITELSAQAVNEDLGTDNTEKEKQLKAWEWRYRLYKRMKAGYEHASK